MIKYDITLDVIIPTFERREELLRAVKSVLCQTYSVNKILIIDDGSSAETREYIEREISVIDSVKVIYNVHTGLPGAMRKIGILESTADYISFLDSDDWWENNKVEFQICELMNSDFIAICSNAWRHNQSGKIEKYFSSKFRITTSSLLKSNQVINSSLMVSRLHLIECGTYADSIRLRAVEDFAMALRLSTLGNIAYDERALVNYQESETSIRLLDSDDPKIFAIFDFLTWLRARAKTRILQIITINFLFVQLIQNDNKEIR